MFGMSCMQRDAHVYGDRDQHVKKVRYMIEKKRYDEVDGPREQQWHVQVLPADAYV